jgi:hypothetical protein
MKQRKSSHITLIYPDVIFTFYKPLSIPSEPPSMDRDRDKIAVTASLAMPLQRRGLLFAQSARL